MGRETDPEEFFQRLRQADMDGDPTEDDLDQLIGTAVRKGRRRVIVRRSIGAVALVAALATVVGVGASVLPGRLTQVGPAVSPTAVPAPTASPTPTPTPTPTLSTSPGQRLTRAELDSVARDLVPSGLTVTKSVGGNPNDYDHSTTIYLTVRDNAGTANLIIGLQPRTGTADPVCDADSRCRKKTIGDATLIYYPGGKNPDKAGSDAQFTLSRPDATDVFFAETNADDGNGPVTRKDLPLTDQQAIDLVTDPVWDALAARCRPNGEDC